MPRHGLPPTAYEGKDGPLETLPPADDGAGDGRRLRDLVLLKVTPQRTDIWDGPDNAVTRTLGVVASIVAGREVGLGQKNVVLPGQGSAAA